MTVSRGKPDAQRRSNSRRRLTALAACTVVAVLASCATTEELPEPDEIPAEVVEWPEQTGLGVTIAILDRGIDWRHADFRHPDGSTRIHSILDMSGQNWCSANNPAPRLITAAEIDAALESGGEIGHADAVGHGTATAGMAAGNGLSLEGASLRGVAPEATLVIVKTTSEGSNGPIPEAAFNACIDDAMAWLDATLTEIGQPAVGLWNAGTQWGPIDGTSAASRAIESVFGPDRPGRIWVVPSGDEGSVPNHAGGEFGPGSVEVAFENESGRPSYPSVWLSGDTPAAVSIVFADGTVLGPVERGASVTGAGGSIVHYEPGTEFDPWTSTSGDAGIWMSLDGSRVGGVVRIESLTAAVGRFDIYGDLLGSSYLTSSITFADEWLVPGRLTDQAATAGAIVAAVHVARTSYIDLDGRRVDRSDEGLVGELWVKSSGGPTRDGRLVIDVSARGQNAYAALGADSAWSMSRGVQPQEGGGKYVVFGGTSAAAPMIAGTIALMLEIDPTLTADDARQILRETADLSSVGSAVPHPDWGYGALDLMAAIDATLARR